jgi:predicted phage terminase large subunit-like protein
VASKKLAPLPGLVEGVDYKVVKGLRVPLKKNKARDCPGCGLFLQKGSFYSALHTHCRKCVRDSGVEANASRGAVAGRPRKMKNEAVAQRAQKRELVAMLVRRTLLGEPVEIPADVKEAYTKHLSAERARIEEQKKVAVSAPQPVADAQTAELAARILARRRLIHYVQRFNPKYMVGWVHADIARRLERFLEQVERRESPRLLLALPPRTGKSKLASEEFPGWAIGKHPEWEFISSSYNVALPATFSRRIRDRVRDPAYQALFPTMQLHEESQSVEVWQTTAGGAYRAAGVGGGITGQGAHIAVVDDPIKNWEEADSAVIREALWDWYMSTLHSRLAPGGGVLVIQTLWNDDDLAGRLQAAAKEGGDQFEVVLYPAINETHDEYLGPDGWEILRVPPGMAPPAGSTLLRPVMTALHPERYSLEELLAKKRNYEALGQRRMWSALYQQNPIPEDGEQFTRDMFVYIEKLPSLTGMYVFQSWDFAITEKQTSDWTVGYCMAVDWDGNLYELDVVRFRSGDNTVIADAICNFHKKWSAVANLVSVGFENGQIWKGIKSTVIQQAKDRKIKSFNYYEMNPLTDKKVRAGPLRGQMQLHRVKMLKNAPWREQVDAELIRFPGGKNDDIVDGAAWCVRTILDHSRPKNPSEEAARREKKPKSWKERLGAVGAGSTTHMAA